MASHPHPHRPHSRRLYTCHRHPTSTPVTGFCASCLRERLAGIQNDSPTTTPVSSTYQLRRSKSCSGGHDPSSSAASEPRRKSCDVRAHNTLHDLFAVDDKIKTLNVNISPSNVEAFQDLEGGGGEGELKTMKELIDLECGRKKASGKSLWEAASVFSKKLRRWRKKQSKKEKSEGLVLEKANRRGLRETQSEIGEYGLFGRRSCDTDPRLSVDCGRLSIDDSRFSIDEPRASWDGFFIGNQNPKVNEEPSVGEERLSVVKEEERSSPGGSAQTRDYYANSLTRRRGFDRSLSNRKISLGEAEDLKSSISNAKVSPETVGLFHGTKLLVTEKELRDSNWYSNVESGSKDVELVANGGVGQKTFNLKKVRGWKNVWSIWGLIQRRKQREAGDEDEDEDKNFGGDVGNGGRLVESGNKLRSVVNGDEYRCVGGNEGEGTLVDSLQKLRRFANGDESKARGNVADGTLAESLQKLRRAANGVENGNVVRDKLLRSYSVSARNSVDGSSFYRMGVSDAKGDGLKRRDNHMMQLNRSVRYSPNNLDNGLLRFYLTPLRSYRRSQSGRSRLRNSNSIGKIKGTREKDLQSPQLKKTLHPSMIQQDSRPSSLHDQHKTRPTKNYFKVASRKLAGFFKAFLLRKRKKDVTDVNKMNSNAQVRRVSFSTSTDRSTGSEVRSSAGFKSFGSYGSSSSASGHIPTPGFSFEDICKATANFSPENKIGEGGFGTVYKGRLKDGSLVAVKRAKKDKYDQGLPLQFKNEILTLSKIEHLNLVRLMGFLEHKDEQIIVVEYVTNGNLREHLDGVKGNGLEIAERLDIAIDVAHGVTYLHTYTDPPIIHRDIKASNILITEKLRAKVADFGFARLAMEDPSATHISTQVKGTAGYVDPEYTRTYQLTQKSDVYSFGVLLVELMTGRYPIESKRPVKERITIRWAMKRLKEGEFVIAMDPKLRRTPASNMVVEEVLKLAQQCLAPIRQSRPSMKQCVEVLWRIRKDFKEKVSSSTAPSTSPCSANFPHRNPKSDRHLFGIQEGDSYGFISA
ncbi:hypothetical protein V6N11_071644 [Hibiscus sabdariffa]|uniref:Protein kinase domain-containing protein n=1 Tax=Hibiscus sabdariffa TaxID=183260 RepID=A0ABR2U1H9_9ROSI